MPEPTATEPSSQTTGTVLPSGNDLAAQVAELQSRITGFQTSLTTRVEELKQANAAKEALAVKLAEESAKASALAADVTKFSTEAATTKDQLERFKVIASKNLVADEEQGLLRTDLKGADFGNYLETYATRLQAAIGQATPPPPSKAGTAPAAGTNRQGAPATRDILNSQLSSATKSGNVADFDKAYDAWVAERRAK